MLLRARFTRFLSSRTALCRSVDVDEFRNARSAASLAAVEASTAISRQTAGDSRDYRVRDAAHFGADTAAHEMTIECTEASHIAPPF